MFKGIRECNPNLWGYRIQMKTIFIAIFICVCTIHTSVSILHSFKVLKKFQSCTLVWAQSNRYLKKFPKASLITAIFFNWNHLNGYRAQLNFMSVKRLCLFCVMFYFFWWSFNFAMEYQMKKITKVFTLTLVQTDLSFKIVCTPVID